MSEPNNWIEFTPSSLTPEESSAFLDELSLGLPDPFQSLLSNSQPKQCPVEPIDITAPSEAKDTPPSSICRKCNKEKLNEDFMSKIEGVSKNLGVNPNYLLAVMDFETGGTFSPGQKNNAGSGATGLIQFMPNTATSLGTSTAALAEMSQVEQMEYVEKYFKGVIGKRTLETLEDTYMAVLYPKAIGKSNDYVLFKQGTKKYKQNKGLDSSEDGNVTKKEAAAKVRERLKNTCTCSEKPQGEDGIQVQGKPESAEEKPDKCDCPQPEENFPYEQETFDYIKQISPWINKFAETNGVSPIAVAGGIADEFNTRGAIDKAQDIFIDALSNKAIEFDDYIDADSKALNSMKHDLGKGNIKLETAKDIYDNNLDSFENKNMNLADLVEYILTDEGTAHLSALYIKEAEAQLGLYMEDYSDAKKEAILVTYYKQGPSYLERFKQAKGKNPDHKLAAGEGCRVCLQRDRFQQALGLPEH